MTTVYSHLRNPSPVSCDDNAFSGVYDNATLYVPTGTKSKYEDCSPWNKFSTIIEKD